MTDDGANISRAEKAWPSDTIERRPVASLLQSATNARKHSRAQVNEIAASIRRFGWTSPVLVDESGVLIAGHGRVMAAGRLGIASVPTMVARGWTKEEIRAFRLIDNDVATKSTWDADMLAAEAADLSVAGFDIAPFGLDVTIEALAGDAVEVDLGAASAQEGRQNQERSGKKVGPVRVPILVTLSFAEHGRWKAMKAARGFRSDREALLSLLENSVS